MIGGLAALLVGNAASLLGAHALVRRMRLGSAHLDVLLLALLRLLLISATIAAAGLTGMLTAGRLGIFAAVVLAALVATGEHRALPRLGLPPLGRAGLVFLAAILLRLLLQAWLFAPYTSDVLSYHLPKIAEWVRAGAFTREMGLDSHATFPAGFELLETFWVVFLHHDVVIEMAGIEMLALGFAATVALARQIGLPARGALLAATLYVMTPGLHLGATSCLNDCAVAALVLSTAALVLGGAPFGLLVMTVGLGAGVKAIYIYALPGLALCAYLERERARVAGGSPRVRAAVAVAALAVGGLWYVRNWLWFGSPIYPMGDAGIVEASGYVTVRFGPSLAGLWDNIRALVDRLMDPEAYSALSRNVSGWGAVGLACGLPALIVTVRDDRRLRRLTAGFLLSLLSVLLLARPDPWCMRFTLFFPAVLALAVARLCETHAGILSIVLPAVALEVAGTMLPAELPRVQLDELAAQPWHERTLAAHYKVQSPEPVLGYFSEGHGESYWLYRPDYTRPVVYLRARSAEALADEMASKGAPVMYTVPFTEDRRMMVERAVRLGRLQSLGNRFYALPDHVRTGVGSPPGQASP